MRTTTIDVTAPSLTTFSLSRPLLTMTAGIRPVQVSRPLGAAPIAPSGGGSDSGYPPSCTCGAHAADDALMNTKQAAAYLRVSAEYLENLRTYGLKRGQPPTFSRIGRRVIYRRSDLDAFVARNSAQTTSEYDPNG